MARCRAKIFVDGHCVRNAVTRVHHTFRRASRNDQEQDSLGRHVRGGHLERLKHDLRHALSVSLGYQKSFREQKGMIFRRNPEFVVECSMPDVLHVVPIRDDTVLDQRSRQTRRSDAQHVYPALGWRHRSHQGGRGRPRRLTTGVFSEVATPRRGATHI